MEQKKSNNGKILTALAAGFGYGGWAVFANLDHGAHIAFMAGAVQATYAVFSTLLITIVAHRVYVKYKCGIRGITTGFALSFLVMLAIPLLVHNYFGTPNIWQTILPGLIWGSIYLMSFLVTLEVKQRKEIKNAEDIVI